MPVMLEFFEGYKGELAALHAAFLWAGSICIFRHFGDGVPSGVINLWKTFIGVVGLLVILIFQDIVTPDTTRHWVLLLGSGVIGLAIGDTFLFVSLKRLGAQTSTAIQCLAPPLAALLAYLLLGEFLSSWQWIGLAVTVGAVLGTVLCGKRPGAHLSSLPPSVLWSGVACSVMAAVCQAVGMVMAREAFQEFDVVSGTLARFVPAVVALIGFELYRGGIPSPGKWKWSRKQFIALTAAAFAGTFLGVLLLSVATKHAQAGVAMAISHTFPVWVVPVAWLTLGEKASSLSIVFTVIAILGVAAMFLAVS